MENIIIDGGAGAMLSWQPPPNPNGVITMYQYVINSSAVNVSAEETSDIIRNLGECMLSVLLLWVILPNIRTNNELELQCAVLHNAEIVH